MRRPGSVRLRVTGVATVAVAVVLVVGGVVLVRTQRSTLVEDVDDVARRIADGIESDLAAGTAPETLVVTGGDDDTVAQVMDDRGQIVAATANPGGEEIFRGPVTDGERVRTLDLSHDEGPFRVLSRRVGDLTIHVALTLDDVDDSIDALIRSLLVTAPLIVLALAGVVWVVVGRTLRPVEEANRRQARFVADASHELRSPLTRIRSELEVDLAHPGRADPLATHASVLEEAERLQRLVDDLLQTARADAGAAHRRREPVDLDDLVLAEADGLRGSDSLAVDLTGVSAAQVLGEPAELARVIRNLADNAARHARSTVQFGVSESGGTAVVTVTDDGPGIPVGDRERVFERFARVDNARTAGAGGTGLGLAIAREIVEAHGGTIAVDPSVADGTRIVVTLPAAH